MSSSEIEIVLFDVGGVLVEVAGIEKLREWTGPNRSDEEIWTMWLHSPAARDFESGRIDADRFAHQLTDELDLPIHPQAMLDDLPTWIAGVLPGAREMLDDVIPGIRRGALSNSNPVHWPRIINEDELGLGAYFDTQFVSHLTGHLKPDADAFAYAIGELGCRPDAIVFVDDNQANVDAAVRAGIRAHLTRGPQEARHVLEQYGLINQRKTSV